MENTGFIVINGSVELKDQSWCWIESWEPELKTQRTKLKFAGSRAFLFRGIKSTFAK